MLSWPSLLLFLLSLWSPAPSLLLSPPSLQQVFAEKKKAEEKALKAAAEKLKGKK